VIPLDVAFNVIKVDAETPVLEIVKFADVFPCGMITPAANDSDLLEPLRATFAPPIGAGPVNVTVPVSVVVPLTMDVDVEMD
jgi:hypothetical protein